MLIVYHSQSGNTRRLAEAAYRGACAEGEVEVRLLRAMAAGSQDLLDCDGVLFGTPENLGYMSGGLKDFFDRSFYPLLPQAINIPYGVFISAGNDGRAALMQLERIVDAYPMRKVAEPIISRGEVTQPCLQRCEELGATLAAGLALGIF